MGNRAVITTKDDFQNNGIGIYLHWCGGRDSVEPFLAYCDLKGYRNPADDCYGLARLCQVIANFIGGTTSIGIDTLNHLDCNNGDNGVYIIDDWRIVGREHFGGAEQNYTDFMKMLRAINEAQPEEEKLSEEVLADWVANWKGECFT